MNSEEIIKAIQAEFTEKYCNEFFNENVSNYVSIQDMEDEGYDGDEECEYYKEHCMGGALEYDLLNEIADWTMEKFKLSEIDYYGDNDLQEAVKLLIHDLDWSDKLLF